MKLMISAVLLHFFVITLSGCATPSGSAFSGASETTVSTIQAEPPQEPLVTANEATLFLVQFMDLELQAFENDLRLYTFVDDENRATDEPGGIIKGLMTLKASVVDMTMSGDVALVRWDLIDMIDALASVAIGIHNKSGDQINAEMQAYWSVVGTYMENLREVHDKHVVFPEIEGDHSPLHAEKALFSDPRDAESFEQAARLFDEREYAAAVDLLEPLLGKYRDQQAEGSVLVRYGQCYIDLESPLNREVDSEERLLEYLNDYVERKPYSVHNYPLYLQWRTLTQTRYGLSNWSVIKNHEYNQVMWGFVESALTHIQENPADKPAKANIFLLLSTPIIVRFPANYHFGNSVVMEHAILSRMFNRRDEDTDKTPEVE